MAYDIRWKWQRACDMLEVLKGIRRVVELAEGNAIYGEGGRKHARRVVEVVDAVRRVVEVAERMQDVLERYRALLTLAEGRPWWS
jgi:hypothetical protein